MAGSGFGRLFHKDEFVAAKTSAAKHGQAVLSRALRRGGSFLRFRRAVKQEVESKAHLSLDAGASLAGQPGGELLALLQHESAVEQVQGLERGDAAHALGGNLAAIRTIERAERAVLLHTNLGHINHPAPLGGSKVLLGIVDPDIVIIRFERAEAGTFRAAVEIPADGEDGVTQRLSLEAPWRKSPEQTRRGIGCQAVRPRRTALAVCGRGHNKPLNVFHAPRLK